MDLSRWWKKVTGSAEAQPPPTPQDPQNVLMRTVISLLVCDRTGIDARYVQGAITFDEAAHECAVMAGAPYSLFGVERLEPIERVGLFGAIGGLQPDIEIRLHWRLECAGTLAWALGLIAEVPTPDRRFDRAELDRVVPHTCEEVLALSNVQLRPHATLLSMRDRLRVERVKAKAALVGHETDMDLSFRNSRALERLRAIEWVLDARLAYLEGTSV